jgi:hypothetical protein
MFSDKHWVEMLDMLGIPNKSVETLKFHDFLQVRENIAANLDSLQVNRNKDNVRPIY